MNNALLLTFIYLFSFGEKPINNLTLSNPQSISVDPNGNIFIADTGNNRILKFSEDGDFLKAIGGFGWGKEQFDFPIDINAQSALDVFIADFNNQRIERYDKDLNYISSLYSDESGSENLQFGYPRGVSISIHGELMLIDTENNRLLKINSFGKPEISFGDFTEGKGTLDDPQQIEIGSDDRIYVSDKATDRIVIFDYFGNYLTEFGSGILNDPLGIFYDNRNRLWVASSGSKEIVCFTNLGEIVGRWKNISPELKAFKDPVDIASTGNRIYVLDKNVVFVFQIK